MYNRYLRNDHGTYTRITPPPCDTRTACRVPPFPHPLEETGEEKKEHSRKAEKGLFDQLLKRFHLGDLDSADLMLLALLFFLFEEKADDELLIALGLLLIL